MLVEVILDSAMIDLFVQESHTLALANYQCAQSFYSSISLSTDS